MTFCTTILRMSGVCASKPNTICGRLDSVSSSNTGRNGSSLSDSGVRSVAVATLLAPRISCRLVWFSGCRAHSMNVAASSLASLASLMTMGARMAPWLRTGNGMGATLKFNSGLSARRWVA
jgi:hypothetical protein